MRLRASVPALSILVALLAGCGPSGPKTYPVSGTVTFDGKPIPDGHVVFSPIDGSVAPDASEIVNGEFHFRAKAGRKLVEITADRLVGKRDLVMNAPRRESYIPARYNTETELEADVTPDGPNEYTFPLVSGSVSAK